jgi:glucosamine-6-phosphate deaminase
MSRPGISVVPVADPREAARLVADEIEAVARERREAGSQLVLGLCTGRTPIAVYDELTRRIRSGALDVSTATAFNLDEYCGLDAGDPRSFAAWMREHFLAPAGWLPSRAWIPSGTVELALQVAHCEHYEASIRAAGGLDLQLLGIGRNGHIGFNEPGSARDSRTRRVRLSPETREDAAREFGSADRVPEFALTMGVATILDARRVRLLAFGAKKRAALERALQGEVGPECPASFLREHADVRIYADEASLGNMLPPNPKR